MSTRTPGLPWARYLLRAVVVLYLTFLVIWPVALVARQTFSGGIGPVVAALRDPALVFAFQLTLVTAVWAVALNTVFGVGISLLLVRHRFPGRRVLSALVDLPMSVSPVVVGLALLLVYGGTSGWFGPALRAAGLQVIYAPPGIVLATTFVCLPLVIREVVPVLLEAGTEAEQAAQTLGANRWQVFGRITLPTIRWAVVYGVVLSFARALGEFGAVKIVSGGVAFRTQTATLLVEERYQQFGAAHTTTAYTAALLLTVTALVALVVVTVLRPSEEKRA
ncbi:sulfate ABC transporter permease subunit [Raineyella fluvialis]|uniref:Sulfate ABC transporter permease subunit n=1 Tax=Raineyella fluvialis TaxID=2662261 RepID=A0A5Q2FD77_9ACTN|nr:sulfate ABC transporter permease subunit [Raineyella fluvialis]QGF24331.1 sulfate ABC transporter permease subunit [Raineyella fluvialis]